jgi:hypothetical protein
MTVPATERELKINPYLQSVDNKSLFHVVERAIPKRFSCFQKILHSSMNLV